VVGKIAMPMLLRIIIETLSCNNERRPIRSLIGTSNRPPIGRIKETSANTLKAPTSCIFAESAGKDWDSIALSKQLNKVMSNH
jgi:hypothetical protein